MLNLDRMRSSEVYRKYTSVSEMVKLEEKYTIGGTVGDQVCDTNILEYLPGVNKLFTGLADSAWMGGRWS